MATGNSSSSFDAFPQLVIDQSDISGSWKKFSDEFLLALELRKPEIDSRYINNPRIKTVALLRAVGHEGRTILQSVGFNRRQSSFEKAFVLLDDYYGRRENIFVKTEKFVSVSQLAGEDDRDYLVRVSLFNS